MKKLATRFAQYPLIAEFDFKFNDWVIDSNDGVKKTLGSSVVNSADPAEPLLTGPAANTIAFDCLNLPADAVICGGEVIVETAYAGPTAATLSVGPVGGSATAFANAVSLLAVGRSALTLTTPMACSAGQNLRMTLNYTVANATAGKARVRVMYTIDGRTSEIQPI